MRLSPLEERTEALRRRALRTARRGEWRKAAVSLREVVALSDRASDWVRLGHALCRAGRVEEARDAYRQALHHLRRFGAEGRARTVARLLRATCPAGAAA